MKRPSWGIAAKLWTVLSLLILGVLAIAAASAWRSTRLNLAADIDRQTAVAKQKLAGQWAHKSEVVVTRVVDLSHMPESPGTEVVRQQNLRDIAAISEVKKAIEAMSLSEADKAQMQRITERRQVVLATHVKLGEYQKAGRPDEAQAYARDTFQPAVKAYYEELNRFATMQDEAVDRVNADLHAATREQALWTLGALALMLSLAAMGAYRLIGSIKGALARTLDAARCIAQGDLTVSCHTDRRDELGALMRAQEAMVRSLNELVGQVRQSTESIHVASSEIARGNHDLSLRTEQTATSLQETASSMEQLSGTVRHYAGTAQEANRLATDATRAVRQGVRSSARWWCTWGASPNPPARSPTSSA